MSFKTHIFADAVECRVKVERVGWLKRLTSRQKAVQQELGQADRSVAIAIADLRALADQLGDALDIDDARIRMSHRLAAAADAETAQRLGLPGLTDYVLETDVQGVLGRGNFRLMTRWLKNGQPRAVRRVGAFLGPEGHERRIPLWMLDALAVSEAQEPSADDARHWDALARFRKALEPGVEMRGSDDMARISMSDFLQKLQVSLTDQFSISPDANGDDFEVVPFYSARDAGGGRNFRGRRGGQRQRIGRVSTQVAEPRGAKLVQTWGEPLPCDRSRSGPRASGDGGHAKGSRERTPGVHPQSETKDRRSN
ncbi:hypothetical protein [Camelimonas lactis]|uniref:hypothetical protein n=1 Tax=Camelimonas lactis TaxID=659006 RepID=UPI001A9F49A4|nr:hypothetical protein [Camelimonas lactis]